MTQKMSLSEYASLVKASNNYRYNTKQSVQYRINQGMHLIGVVRRELVSGRNVLTVDKSLIITYNKKTFKKSRLI
jgi:hypothetical protein